MERQRLTLEEARLQFDREITERKILLKEARLNFKIRQLENRLAFSSVSHNETND